MISEESSAKPGIVLCPHYHFLLWNWKSMSSAVLVYDFLCLVQTWTLCVYHACQAKSSKGHSKKFDYK